MGTTIIVAIIGLVAAILSLIAALAGISVPFISHWLKQRETAKKKPRRTTDIPPAQGHNPFFTGREEIIAEIKKKLHSAGRVVLTGIAGVGKTQAAAEYAYRESYKRVLWVTADSRDSLTSGFAALAQKGRPLEGASGVCCWGRWLTGVERLAYSKTKAREDGPQIRYVSGDEHSRARSSTYELCSSRHPAGEEDEKPRVSTSPALRGLGGVWTPLPLAYGRIRDGPGGFGRPPDALR